jgi:hypothetical protein
VDLKTGGYFAIADEPDMSYDEKLAAYLALADDYFETERYWEWCAEHLGHLEERVHDWVASDDFDRILRETVAATYPAGEYDEFLAHFRGLMSMWLNDNASPHARP